MSERDPEDVAAQHGELDPRDPIRDSFTPEQESDRAGAEYGEADEARSEDRPDEP